MIHVSALFKPSSGTGFKMYEYTRGKQYSCEVTFFFNVHGDFNLKSFRFSFFKLFYSIASKT